MATDRVVVLPARQRVAVIGAGAIGGTIAALLERAGHEVTVTARGAHLAAIRAHGLRIQGGVGPRMHDRQVRLKVKQRPAGRDRNPCRDQQQGGKRSDAEPAVPVDPAHQGLDSESQAGGSRRSNGGNAKGGARVARVRRRPRAVGQPEQGGQDKKG